VGFIRDQFGQITIESRRESFIVHAGYGYVPGRKPVGDLRPGDEFRFPHENRWEVTGLFKTEVEAVRLDEGAEPWMIAKPVGGGQATELTLPIDALVFVDGFEEDAEGALAKWWRDAGHPEFLIEDLDDLIRALADFAASRR
jgi:hypothetical protein